MLPKSYAISNSLLNTSPWPAASGAFADVYEGILNSSKVCVKKARIRLGGDPRRVQKVRPPLSPSRLLFPHGPQLFYQEAVVWKHLVHPNIVPFRGVTAAPLQLISDWMSGGDLTNYINQHPDANLLGLVGPSLRMPGGVLTPH